MNERKSKKVFTWRVNLFIFLVFSFGCMFGVGISDLPSVLDAYLSRSVETNAYGYVYSTTSNATSGNLIPDYRPPYATRPNATSGNATGSNSAIDNIYLTQMNVKNREVKPGERMYLEFSTQGNCLNGATFTFINFGRTSLFSAQLKYETDGTKYIDIPDDVLPGSYVLRDVLLVGTSNYRGTFSKTYSTDSAISAYRLSYSPEIVVLKDETKKDIKLNSLTFEKKEAKIGDKLYFTLSTDDEVTSAKFTFKNEATKDNIVAYMREESGKKYISFASNTKEGEYSLVSVALTNSNVTTLYSQEDEAGATTYSFNTKLKLTNSDQEKLEYNNEDITEEILVEIRNATKVKTVIINADAKSIVSSEVFSAVQGRDVELVINYRNNQYTFYGRDIAQLKDIDVSVKVEALDDRTKSTDIKKLVPNGIVISFASNGELPSKAQVKLNQTNIMKKVLGNKNINVYFYDEYTKMFEEVALNVSLQEGTYYLVPITHNSRFVLTTDKIDASLIQATEDENVVSFLMSNKVYLILIILAIVLIVVIIVVLVVYKKKKGEKTPDKKEEVKPQIEEQKQVNTLNEQNPEDRE